MQREKTKCFIFVTIAGEKKVICGANEYHNPNALPPHHHLNQQVYNTTHTFHQSSLQKCIETLDIFNDANQFHTQRMVFVRELLVVTTNCIPNG